MRRRHGVAARPLGRVSQRRPSPSRIALACGCSALALAARPAQAEPFPPLQYFAPSASSSGSVPTAVELEAPNLITAISEAKQTVNGTLEYDNIPEGSEITLITTYARLVAGTQSTYRVEFQVLYAPPNKADPVFAEVSLPDGDVVANAFSDNLTVVGRYASNTDRPSSALPNAPPFGAFEWTPSGGLQPLPFAYALGISADGSVIVGGTSTNGIFDYNQVQQGATPGNGHAVRYTAALGAVDLGALNGPTGQSVAVGTSADGAVVVGNSSRDTGFVNIDPAFNPNFPVIAHLVTTTDAVRWDVTNATMGAFTTTDLGHLPDRERVDSLPDQYADLGYSAATAVSADGSTVVGFGNAANPDGSNPYPQPHALLWARGGSGAQDLGVLPNLTSSKATAVSGDGAIVVGYAYGAVGFDPVTMQQVVYEGPNSAGISSETRAFRWTTATGMRDLNTLLTNAGVSLGGGVLLTATAISADGSLIAGQAVAAGAPGNSNVAGYVARYIDAAVAAPPAPPTTPTTPTPPTTPTTPTTPTEPTTPTGPTTPIAGLTTPASVQASVDQLARARTRLLVQSRGFLSPITDDADPFLAPTQAHAFVAGDDVNGGFRGRLNGPKDLTLLGGVSWGSQSYGSVRENGVTSGTVALRWAPALFRGSRPFLEAGYSASHGDGVKFARTYANGDGEATGVGGSSTNASEVYGRAGWVWTPAPADQFGVYAEYGRQRQSFAAYVEPLSTGNPFEAHVAGDQARQDVARAGLRYSHDPLHGLTWGLNAAVGHGFDADPGLEVAIPGVGALTPQSASGPTWFEYTARLGYGLGERVTVGAFVTGVAGAVVGSHARPGLDVRLRF